MATEQQNQEDLVKPQAGASKQLESINRQAEEKKVIIKAKKSGLSYIDIANIPVNPDLLEIIPEETARKAMIMPFFKVGKKLRVAVLDPENKDTLKIIKDLHDQEYLINTSLASRGGLEEAFQLYQSKFRQKKIALDTTVDETQLGSYEEEIANLEKLKDKIENSSPLEAANYLLVGSVKTHASDIHLEPYEKEFVIRFRIDGVLQEILKLKPDRGHEIANQIKHLAKITLNISDKPQDGRLYFTVNERKIDVRVSTLPAFYGESIVMRILDSERRTLSLEELGLTKEEIEIVNRALSEPNGIILSTGPTGSGKTTTLYTMLKMISHPENKVITMEDPVEYHVPGIIQSQVEPDKNYDFADGLRAILRQDPDIVMVGEIRDLETAEIASQAALTGHLVLSTLHTNNSIASIPRLMNMGLKGFMIGPALNLIIAQRLVRRICPKCHEDVEINPDIKTSFQEHLEAINTYTNEQYVFPDKVMKPVGCEFCSHTGYHGQIGLFELFAISKEIEQMILENKSTKELFEEARKNGFLTLRENGLIKVIERITTFEEILRVTADVE